MAKRIQDYSIHIEVDGNGNIRLQLMCRGQERVACIRDYRRFLDLLLKTMELTESQLAAMYAARREARKIRKGVDSDLSDYVKGIKELCKIKHEFNKSDEL